MVYIILCTVRIETKSLSTHSRTCEYYAAFYEIAFSSKEIEMISIFEILLEVVSSSKLPSYDLIPSSHEILTEVGQIFQSYFTRSTNI